MATARTGIHSQEETIPGTHLNRDVEEQAFVLIVLIYFNRLSVSQIEMVFVCSQSKE
jgi:hypothetical protein